MLVRRNRKRIRRIRFSFTSCSLSLLFLITLCTLLAVVVVVVFLLTWYNRHVQLFLPFEDYEYEELLLSIPTTKHENFKSFKSNHYHDHEKHENDHSHDQIKNNNNSNDDNDDDDNQWSIMQRKTKHNNDWKSGNDLKRLCTEGIQTYHRPMYDLTSNEGWDDILPFVKDARPGSLCFSWTTGQNESDRWWIHHPDFEVFQETDFGYCFRPIPDELKRDYMTIVYRNQFPSTAAATSSNSSSATTNANATTINNNNNNNKKNTRKNCSNVFVTRMWSSGWSADITNLVHTLQYAMLQGRPMQITSNPWHYAAPDQAKRSNQVPSPPACPLLNMYCYFLNLSNCPVQKPGTHDKQYDYRHPPYMSTRSTNYLPDYITRPQTWLRHRVYLFVRDQQRRLFSPSNERENTTATLNTSMPIPVSAATAACTVVHVRRGDVLHHGKISRRYHAISEYLQVASSPTLSSSMSSPFPLHSNILLLTDDSNAIEEAKQYTDYQWKYIDRPRFQADEGGWEHQIPSSNPIFEMTVLLGTFQLVRQCQSLVYSTSGFSQILLHQMQKEPTSVIVSAAAAANGLKKSRNTEIASLNLDDISQYDLGTHNVQSKNISTIYQTNKTKTS